MQNPITLEVITHLGATGTAGVSKVDTILSAPGVGFRYRIWYTIYCQSNNTTAAGVFSGILREGAIRRTWQSFVTNSSPMSAIYHPGGYAMNENSPIDWETFQSIAAAQQYRLTVGYTIEAVT